MMGTVTLLAAWTAALLAARAAAETSAAAAAPAPAPPRIIGYYDANAQQELPLKALRHGNLTHLVVTNAVKVDNNATLHYRSPERPDELSALDLIKSLASLPGIRVVVSLRGHPDDVALDELAEVDAARERFVTETAILMRGWGVSGLEIEWHSDDLAGGKTTAAPFDKMEQYHFALLCRDLASTLRAAGGKTLSVAVRPGRQEFTDGTFVRHYIDWLALRAYSMRSLGDPHHSSLKDMAIAFQEWEERGVPRGQLVLGTPFFGRPGAALHTAGDRNEALRRTWGELVHSGLLAPKTGTGAAGAHGDVFVDAGTGKVWWVSGIDTTKAKVHHVLKNGYGGVAFRDLHHDAAEPHLSLVEAALEAVRERREEEEEAKRARRSAALAPGVVLFQRAVRRSRSDAPASSAGDEGGGHDEF